MLCREKEEAEKEVEGQSNEVNQSKPKSSAVKCRDDNDDDDDGDDDITDLYDLEHYDSDEDLEGKTYTESLYCVTICLVALCVQVT